MHWYLFVPLVLALSAAQLFTGATAQFGHEAVKKDSELGERDKRIPYYYPIRPYLYNQARGEDLDEDENEFGFDRKRRTPFFYAAPRFWKSHKAAADEDDDDLENEEEGFDRKRRIPYFYPHHGYGMRPSAYDEELEDLEEKRSMKKRGNPYYFPSLNYNFLPRPDESARKRYTDLKRSLKRSLSDALEHDDVTDFGYDKRQQGMDDNEEDDKKKRKRVVVKKNV